MMPRLGQKNEVDLETISRSREEYQREDYQAAGLPAAPAVMVDNELAAQGPEITAEKIERVIRQHLQLPPLAP